MTDIDPDPPRWMRHRKRRVRARRMARWNHEHRMAWRWHCGRHDATSRRIFRDDMIAGTHPTERRKARQQRP